MPYPDRRTFVTSALSGLSLLAALPVHAQGRVAARAESPEIDSMIHPDAAAPAISTDHNPLIQAVKKLTGKD